MTATQGSPAFGTLLKIGDGQVSETFTTVAEVKNLSGPGFSREFVEVTHHTSPDGYREYLPTFKSAGEVSCTLNFLPDDATQDDSTGILADFEAGTKRNFQIVFPVGAGKIASFAAYVANFGPIAANVDGVLEAPLTLRLSGGVAWSDVTT